MADISASATVNGKSVVGQGDGEDPRQIAGQGEFQMRMARGGLSLDKNAPDYKGPGGEDRRTQDRENYKTETGMYPEDDPDLIASEKRGQAAAARAAMRPADRRYGKPK